MPDQGQLKSCNRGIEEKELGRQGHCDQWNNKEFVHSLRGKNPERRTIKEMDLTRGETNVPLVEWRKPRASFMTEGFFQKEMVR